MKDSKITIMNKYFKQCYEVHKQLIPSNYMVYVSMAMQEYTDQQTEQLKKELSELKAKHKEGEKIINFLRGIGEFDGVWFGDVPNGKPKYWWREELDKYYTQTHGQ